jgi:TP901 family phage tail tape measure protein
LLKNVGDNIDDVNTSSSYLISTLQGFGLLADQAEDVVNKIDAVANTQPVTAKDLGEILTRSSAAMSAANNTLEETIALGTAANAVIQDADTVGTTLKSLSMYLRAAKSDAENAGIEVDGMANSVSELRSELKSLTGVDIMLDSKNFKSTYQIMKELSQVWSGLSDVTQANVTEMIGGKRNANAVSAILNNFDVAESAMESAANSANVAWEENEKYLDSIQGRLAQLNASFQVLSQDVLSSGLVKSGVSFLTSIVKLLDKIINLTGALPAGLGIAAFATQLGEPKMTGFMIVPSNTPGGDTEQVLRRYYIIYSRSMREYLVKPTNMVT